MRYHIEISPDAQDETVYVLILRVRRKEHIDDESI